VNPDRKREDGKPECFGHCGYGDGYAGGGRCRAPACEWGPQCYADLRERVEREHVLEWEGYETERQQLRDQGLDSLQIVALLAAKGNPPPTQDEYLKNVRQGQLDSGQWVRCAEPGCEVLVRPSGGYGYCFNHRPEDEDGPEGTRDSGQVSSTRDGSSPDQP
jgi:hypothetical protein